ncbi:MAG: DUF6359 domain-containing protein [Bacteroidia bacterium]|nr:DUF6359 domain-containing protein [Bacteroidia bacterium]
MKDFKFPMAVVAAALIFSSCDAFIPEGRPGKMSLHFSSLSYMSTKASADVPDTNSFILSIANSKGESVYNGSYGSSPLEFDLAPDTYSVSVISTEFKAPKYSSPQYGDKQLVVVSAGASCSVELLCRQMNAGVKLNISENFLTSYPNGSLHLKNDDGKLMYGYSERRIAYFRPGQVSLILSNGAKDETLMTRVLESQEILVLNVSASSKSASASSGITIQLDTTRFWNTEDYVIGQGSSTGKDKNSALGVGQAKSNAGRTDVWVYGYIVGGDLSSSSVSFKAPFSSRTNIALSSRSSATDRSSCMSVQLQKGKIRDALNLVDNPDNLGKEVFLKGDIVESYYGIPGIQNITEYEFK